MLKEAAVVGGRGSRSRTHWKIKKILHVDGCLFSTQMEMLHLLQNPPHYRRRDSHQSATSPSRSAMSPSWVACRLGTAVAGSSVSISWGEGVALCCGAYQSQKVCHGRHDVESPLFLLGK
jgi:hypothetical protein